MDMDDFTKSIRDVASNAADTALDAAKSAADAIENAKQIVDEAFEEMGNAPIEEYKLTIEKTFEDLKGTLAISSLDALGESPLALTESLADKVKSTFPVPREQTVVWADAEFDLRPSGIVATDRGVFIKTDAKVFSFFAGLQDDDLDSEEIQAFNQSSLSYYPWEYFDASYFVSDSPKANIALRVNPDCTSHFVESCREIKAHQDEERQRHRGEYAPVDGRVNLGIKGAAIESASILSSEEASFVQQKALINNQAGHGEVAEYANHRIDLALGKKATWEGPKNEANGADRIVWERSKSEAHGIEKVFIQTKYCKTPMRSLEAAFDPKSHLYRYYTENGQPMDLEVPKDQYHSVLAGFEEKIKQGKVPGVTDPKEAKNIVRSGKLTYAQAVNITKPGTIESLTYDAATGAVICSCAFGISFLAASFMAYRKTRSMDVAIQAGIQAGIQVFGISFVQHMVVNQLSRTGLPNMLLAPSKYITEQVLGYKASQAIVNSIRSLMGKSAIGGAAATNQLSKMLRSNAVTAAATFVIFSVPETYRLASRKASGAQYAKNLASLAASIAGGVGGVVAAGAVVSKYTAAAGTTIAPGVGTAIGVAGGFVVGSAAAAVTNVVGGILHEGDGATFGRLFNALVSEMSYEYLLDANEMDMLVKKLDEVPQKDFKKLMDDTFSADEQEKAIRGFLSPMYDEVVSMRERFEPPSDDEMMKAFEGLVADLEEGADSNPSCEGDMGVAEL